MLLDLSLPARLGRQSHQAGFAVDVKRVTDGEDRRLGTPRVDQMIMPLTSIFGATITPGGAIVAIERASRL